MNSLRPPRSPLFLLWICLSLFFLAPFFYAYGFCYPRGDDYDNITRAMFLFDLPGALYEVIREWLTWSGRYTYHFLAVFLGKSALNPFSCGLVCFSILFLYLLAFFQLFRLAKLNIPLTFCFSLTALCVLMGCHANLPDFYLLTDALTIVLQGGLYLLFLVQIFKLCQERDEIKNQRTPCIILGLAAIGVYEHAALAVFWTLAAVYSIHFLFDKNLIPLKNSVSFSIGKWLLAGLLLSFLAPGNLQRKGARNTDIERQIDQLISAPGDWLAFIGNFLLSSLPLAVLCLALLLRVYASPPAFSKKSGLYLSFLPIGTFILFSLSLFFLHALSDVPLSSEPKLAASLDIYAGIALGLFLFFLPFQWGRGNRLFTTLLFSLLLAILSGSSNLHKTAINAANGQMLEYADFMEVRKSWLSHLSRLSAITPDPFGLAGELFKKDVRKRLIRPGEAIVQSFPRAVFPVHMKLDLAAKPEAWPNLWAAWVYGTGSIAMIPPDSEKAVEAVQKGKGVRLIIPEELHASGLSEAWLYQADKNPNPTLDNAWLVVKADKALKIRILLPSLPCKFRLLPLFLQKNRFRDFTENNIYSTSLTTPFYAVIIEARAGSNHTAVWLKPINAPHPYCLFASVDGLIYHKLSEKPLTE